MHESSSHLSKPSLSSATPLFHPKYNYKEEKWLLERIRIPDNTVYNQETQESIRLTSLPFHSISHSLPSPSFRLSLGLHFSFIREAEEGEGMKSDMRRDREGERERREDGDGQHYEFSFPRLVVFCLLFIANSFLFPYG